MRVLLDTHALVWSLTDPARLSATARDLIASPTTSLLVSAASAWEIATKQRLGKLPGADALMLSYVEHLRRLGADELSILTRHALMAGAMSWVRRDPFDRMLAAQSIVEALPIITKDRGFESCSGVRVIW